jgi:hypothetical protein
VYCFESRELALRCALGEAEARMDSASDHHVFERARMQVDSLRRQLLALTPD